MIDDVLTEHDGLTNVLPLADPNPPSQISDIY